jgi:hypothetical protein
MTENQYTFRVCHGKELLCFIVAHTKWEAVERAMFQTGWRYDRKKINAKKVC